MYNRSKNFFAAVIGIEALCITLLSSGVALTTTWIYLKYFA